MNTKTSLLRSWLRRIAGLTTAAATMLSLAGTASARILFEDDTYFNIQSEGIILDYNDNIYQGLASTLTNQTITYTADANGVAGDGITITLAETAPADLGGNSATIAVTAVGNAITVTFQDDTNIGNPESVGQIDIRECINSASNTTTSGSGVNAGNGVACTITNDVTALITATGGTAATDAVALSTTSLSGGANGGDIKLQIGNDGSDAAITYNDTTQDISISTPGSDISFSNNNITTTGAVNMQNSSAYHIREVSGDPNTVAACASVDEVVLDTTTNKIYVCTGTGTATVATWATPSADTLNGLTSSQFLRSDTSDSFTSGTLTFNALTILDANGAVDFSGASSFLLYQGLNNPGTCTEGEIFYNTTVNATYVCTAANTWSALSTAGTPNFEAVYGADGDQTLTTSNGDFSIAAGTGAINFDSTNAAGISLNDGVNGPVNIGTGASTGTVTIGGTGAQTIAVGNGAGAKTVSIGSSNTTSTTTLLSGSGGLNFNVNNNQATNINTGTSTGTTTIGGGSGDVTINGKVVGITSNGGNDVTITSSDDIIFDDAQLVGIVQMTGAATDWDVTFSSDGIIDNINSFASTVNGEGASNVGIEDVGNYFGGSTVESALQTLGASTGKRVEDLTFYPEYPDTVVYADGTNNKGTLESYYDTGEVSGYYNWTSANGVTQDIELRFDFPIPQDFSATGNFTYRYRTGTVTEADNDVEVVLYNVTDAATCASDLTNGTAGVWATGTILAASINGGCAGLSAGDIVEVQIKLYDNVGAADYADVGKVIWNYTK